MGLRVLPVPHTYVVCTPHHLYSSYLNAKHVKCFGVSQRFLKAHLPTSGVLKSFLLGLLPLDAQP